MIKQEIIKELYKKFPLTLEANKEIDLRLLQNEQITHHAIELNGDELIINSVTKDSPFHEIPIKNIAGIQEFDNHIAIILRNSILFLNKSTTDIHVHINLEKPTLWERIKYAFKNEE